VTLHYASLRTSKRLHRALSALEEFPGGLTTRQWSRRANICACNSVAAELRAQGIPITCTHEGRTKDGGQVFRYRIK
jgi:hypothetical protein